VNNTCTVEIITTVTIDGEGDTIETTCPALYVYTPDLQTIVYDQQEEYGVIHNTVKVSERVEIIREGMMSLMLEKGRTVEDEYATPYGIIPLSYCATTIESAMDEKGGRLLLCYDMTIGGVQQFNSVTITVKSN